MRVFSTPGSSFSVSVGPRGSVVISYRLPPAQAKTKPPPCRYCFSCAFWAPICSVCGVVPLNLFSFFSFFFPSLSLFPFSLPFFSFTNTSTCVGPSVQTPTSGIRRRLYPFMSRFLRFSYFILFNVMPLWADCPQHLNRRLLTLRGFPTFLVRNLVLLGTRISYTPGRHDRGRRLQALGPSPSSKCRFYLRTGPTPQGSLWCRPLFPLSGTFAAPVVQGLGPGSRS